MPWSSRFSLQTLESRAATSRNVWCISPFHQDGENQNAIFLKHLLPCRIELCLLRIEEHLIGFGKDRTCLAWIGFGFFVTVWMERRESWALCQNHESSSFTWLRSLICKNCEAKRRIGVHENENLFIYFFFFFLNFFIDQLINDRNNVEAKVIMSSTNTQELQGVYLQTRFIFSACLSCVL